MAYRIVFEPRAVKELASLPRRERRRVAERIDALAGNPFPPDAKALQGSSKGLHRIRIGDYRVIYHVVRSVLTVTIIRIGQRGDVYRGM